MLIVEDGTGLANSESLAGVAEFYTYHAKLGNVAAAVIPEAGVEILLRRATNYITGVYRSAFIGRKAVVGQAQEWPRTSNSVGYFNLSTYGVPREVREAVIELALIADTQDLFATPKRSKSSVRIGPIAVQYDALGPSATRFVSASLKLAPWLTAISANPNMARLVRR